MSDNKAFVKEALKAHNAYRAKHGVPDLKLNNNITTKAQKWAQHMADSGDFKHCPDRNFKKETLGENIAMKWTSSGDDFTGDQVTDQWYSEIERYDFKNHQGSSAGHFSQVVWKHSKEFGIGRAKDKSGKWLVVANYLPAGNFIGQHPENVFPPKDGVISSKPKDKEPAKTADKDAPPAPPAAAAAAAAVVKLNNGDVDVAEKPTTAAGSQKKSTTSRQTTKETRNGVTYTKTITKETIENEDGTKKVITREVLTTDKLAAADKVSDGHEEDKKPTKHGIQTVKPDKSEDAMKKFAEDTVEQHNKYRKKHGADDVTHNSELSAMAQKWAENLAELNALKHSDYTYKGDQLGENIASKWSSAGADYTGEEVVDQWYGEADKYEFGTNEFKQGTGHFSQVVWKNTRQIGVGKAFGKDGRVFVVITYHPPGNVIGRFRDNVQEAKEE